MPEANTPPLTEPTPLPPRASTVRPPAKPTAPQTLSTVPIPERAHSVSAPQTQVPASLPSNPDHRVPDFIPNPVPGAKVTASSPDPHPPGVPVAASPTHVPNPGQTPPPMTPPEATGTVTTPVPKASVTPLPPPNAMEPTTPIPKASVTPVPPPNTTEPTSPIPRASVTPIPPPNATEPTSPVQRASVIPVPTPPPMTPNRATETATTPVPNPPPMQTPVPATPVVPSPLQKKAIENQRNNLEEITNKPKIPAFQNSVSADSYTSPRIYTEVSNTDQMKLATTCTCRERAPQAPLGSHYLFQKNIKYQDCIYEIHSRTPPDICQTYSNCCKFDFQQSYYDTAGSN